jgi:transcriptional regulator of acetoin/glycerol metabolism
VAPVVCFSGPAGFLMPLMSLVELQPDGVESDDHLSIVRNDSLILKAVVHKHIHFVLDLNCGNKLRTARQLGISRSTLYRMLEDESTLSR